MAGTFSQIHIQLVFAVHGRSNLLLDSWRSNLFEYISGIVRGKEQKSIIVNGMPDHVHILVGLKPAMAIADLVRDIKNNSSNWVNDRSLVRGEFRWQAGYGAFSYGHSQLDKVYRYILNQERHHRKISFREEYLEFLERFEIEYQNRYLFNWLE